MSESTEILEDEETDHLDPNIRAELRKSREYKKEAESLKSEMASFKRELAFTKAGIPEEGVGALLRKAYDGDISPEAIRSAAAEYGIGTGQMAETSQHDPIRDELEQHRNIAGATGGNTSGPTPEQEFLAAMQGASTEDEVLAVINTYGGTALGTPGMR